MVNVHQLDIHLTHRCNLRCSYCYAGHTQKGLPPDLSPELADKAVDFLLDSCGDAPRIRIDLWGGEPFLKTDLIERIAIRARGGAQARGKQLLIVIPTNVTLLDRQIRDLIRRYDIQISLSLDGGHNAHRSRLTASGKSSWDLIEPRLKALISESDGTLPPVRMTIVPDRAVELCDDLAYLQRLGFRQISFMPASGASWTPGAKKNLKNSLRQIADRFIKVVISGQRIPSYPHIMRRLTPLWVGATHGSIPQRRGYCGAGETLIAVDTVGDLYPCHRLVSRRKPPAELRLGSLDEGITNSALGDKLRRIGADEEQIRCSSCSYRPSCGRLCIALNYGITGDVAVVPDEACFVNRTLGTVADYIHSNLVDNVLYAEYIEEFLAADPDERLLPVLAMVQKSPDEFLDRVSALLGDLDISLEP